MTAQNNDYPEFQGCLDVNGGLERTLGNMTLYCKLLKSFSGGSMVEDLIKSFGQDDLKIIGGLVHTLKGTVANLGLARLFEVAKEIEKEVRAGKKPGNVNELVKAASETAAAIDKFLKMQTS